MVSLVLDMKAWTDLLVQGLAIGKRQTAEAAKSAGIDVLLFACMLFEFPNRAWKPYLEWNVQNKLTWPIATLICSISSVKGVLGYGLFGEGISLHWLGGICLILIGTALVSAATTNPKPEASPHLE